MDKEFVLNFIGYVGSALVLVSFLMASVLKLRIINTAGCVASVIYSICINAYPTLVMNAALIVINVYYIIKIIKHRNIYHIIPSKMDDIHLDFFFDFYWTDLHKFFPEFRRDAEADVVNFVYCENVAVGVFIAKKINDTALDILLDYSTPAFRDCSVGKHIYADLKANGIKKVILTAKTNNHESYLSKMEFENCNSVYQKIL